MAVVVDNIDLHLRQPLLTHELDRTGDGSGPDPPGADAAGAGGATET
ncbi:MULTISPECIES: hypothetical protein [unclassified Cyanobium]|nr:MULTISPECIES: hypothetical protein [unclassified Cyanobium]